jgi:hypothetical protein
MFGGRSTRSAWATMASSEYSPHSKSRSSFRIIALIGSYLKLPELLEVNFFSYSMDHTPSTRLTISIDWLLAMRLVKFALEVVWHRLNFALSQKSLIVIPRRTLPRYSSALEPEAVARCSCTVELTNINLLFTYIHFRQAIHIST